MFTRFDMAEGLVARGKKRGDGQRLDEAHACRSGRVTLDLLISTKEVIDLLRSALDFCAREVFERCHGRPPTVDEKVYFPIAKRKAKHADFAALASNRIPRLKDLRPGLIPMLASFQEFTSADNGWLPDLAKLSVESKHDRLSMQLVVPLEFEVMPPHEGRKVIGIRRTDGMPLGAGFCATVTGSPLLGGGVGTRSAGAYFRFDGVPQTTQAFLQAATEGAGRVVQKLKDELT